MATRAARGLGQYSGVARAIERVGERWALLIVRDLLVGARRYSDLKAGLPRIPTNILSDRLKELQEAGVVRRVPTVRGGYELTELGRALEPVIVALERWGWSTLGEPAEGEIVTADALVIALGTAFQPVAQDVRRDAREARLQVAVPARADEQVADDEQCPSLPDPLDGSCHAAVLAEAACGACRHGAIRPATRRRRPARPCTPRGPSRRRRAP